MEVLILLAHLLGVAANMPDTMHNDAVVTPKYKYECTTTGIKNMIVDGLEDETIKVICKGEK